MLSLILVEDVSVFLACRMFVTCVLWASAILPSIANVRDIMRHPVLPEPVLASSEREQSEPDLKMSKWQSDKPNVVHNIVEKLERDTQA